MSTFQAGGVSGHDLLSLVLIALVIGVTVAPAVAGAIVVEIERWAKCRLASRDATHDYSKRL